eukprot:1063793-Amphidinium_carterae.2
MEAWLGTYDDGSDYTTKERRCVRVQNYMTIYITGCLCNNMTDMWFSNAVECGRIIADVAALLLHRLRELTRSGRTAATRFSAVQLKQVMKFRVVCAPLKSQILCWFPHQVGGAVLFTAALMLYGALCERKNGR